MLEWLRPRLYLNRASDLDLDQLWSMGIRGIISDLDNTLVRWDASEAGLDLRHWLARLQKRGFKVCLVSNGRAARVAYFSAALGVPGISRARKPSRRAFREGMSTLGTAPHQTAVLGDQLFTDVLGGNRLGLYTILVPPLARREFLGTRLVRIVERLVLTRLRPSHSLPPGGVFPSGEARQQESEDGWRN